MQADLLKSALGPGKPPPKAPGYSTVRAFVGGTATESKWSEEQLAESMLRSLIHHNKQPCKVSLIVPVQVKGRQMLEVDEEELGTDPNTFLNIFAQLMISGRKTPQAVAVGEAKTPRQARPAIVVPVPTAQQTEVTARPQAETQPRFWPSAPDTPPSKTKKTKGVPLTGKEEAASAPIKQRCVECKVGIIPKDAVAGANLCLKCTQPVKSKKATPGLSY